MGTLTRSDTVTVVIAAPVAALAVSWLALLGWALVGGHPIWTVRARNLAEAAAFRDGAEIVRRVSAGERLDVPAEVRHGFISGSAAVTVTPLEAAAKARRIEIVRLLLDLEPAVDPATWARAWCIEEDEGIRAALADSRPGAATTECGPAEER